jgi:pantetheine-phosphate adenylyltransferase
MEMKVTKIAIYPGSFDPLTHGHVDLIQRAAQLFDQVIVAVATNTRKTTWLSLEQRLTLVTEALVNFPKVQVAPCHGVMVEFAQQQRVTAIVRGLRTAADYDNEFQLAGMNRQMAPEIISIFLPASTEYSFISATLVREIVTLGGDIANFVPAVVLRRLTEWHKIN